MSLVRDVIDSVLFPNKEMHAIPVLDGAFSPNSRLDRSRALGEPIVRPDDFVLGPDGALYVSSETTVLRCTGADYTERAMFARLPGTVGALAWTRDDRLLAGVSGVGIVALSLDGREVGLLGDATGTRIECPTAVTVADDGTVYLCDGSRSNRPEDWLPDLMQRRPPSGRLITCAEDLTGAAVIADELDWPNGVAVSHDGRGVLTTEAWAHRLTAFARNGGARRPVVKNYAAYPARIAADPAGGYWMAFFGMRTQLVEFVLRERDFCEAMMARVPRELWIGPSLEGRFDHREPTQIGRIKKLGIQKPWAPPRSYGLVARLGPDGEAVESLHSRVDGQLHGVTAVRRVGSRVLAVVKGRDRLVELALEGEAR
jgi:sugar lactone lactonase YvrE